MAKRLIDAEALKRKAVPEEESGEGVVYVQDIDEAPTVDAVEVVRCRDCKWDKPDKLLCKHWCPRFVGCMEMREDDFCSYGERKEG